MIDPTLDRLLSIVVPGAGLAIVAVGVYRLAREAVRHFRDTPPDPRLERIAAMSVREAEAAARELLQGGHFEVQREPLLARQRGVLDTLPRITQSFFSDYAEVSGAGARLSRALIAPWAIDSSYIYVGSDLNDASIVVGTTDDRVFVVERDASVRDAAPGYRSLWHYLLEIAVHEQ